MSETLHRTPLAAVHRALGARMVAFAGWEMPRSYGSELEEHRAVRRDAGMFDVSHMLAVDVSGEGALALLRRLLANDPAKLTAPGMAFYSCMLNHDGGVLDDLVAYRIGAHAFRLVLNAACARKDLDWIGAHCEAQGRQRPRVEPRRDLAIVAVQGPRAREKTWRAAPRLRAASERLARFRAAFAGETFIARTGYTGEDGFEILLPAGEAAALWEALRGAGVAPAGLAARDTLRLEAGLKLYGQDMDETVTPFEAGLGATVDFGAERDFIGRRALAAKTPLRRLLGLVLLEPGVMRRSCAVRCAAGGGEVTSGGFSPTLGCSIALARLPAAAAPGAAVEVEVRGRWLRARAVEPPFVRYGKILVAGGEGK